ncbi:unnamed protein product, partial [Mesorhabditis spiculigera]
MLLRRRQCTKLSVALIPFSRKEIRCMEKVIEEQRLRYGVVCSRATSGTQFVRFVDGQLMLTRHSRPMLQESAETPAKVGDIIAFAWKKYANLNGCIGVVDRYLVVPPEKQKSSFSASVKNHPKGGHSVMVSCEMEYVGKEDSSSVFINEHLGRIFDDVGKVPNESLLVGGRYQCLITRHDDRKQNIHYWMVVHCQFFPESILNGPTIGFATKLPGSEHAIIWPCHERFKRPLRIIKETQVALL